MARYARILRLQKGRAAEYERYHTQVWPDVLEACRQAGLKNYSIYRYGEWLFSYYELPECADLPAIQRLLTDHPACQRWEAIMHQLQERLPESAGENWWVPMREVFHFTG